jgi:UDP-N-acetyl-2-amino-2-deoxyglucuronate dehydrogenase
MVHVGLIGAGNISDTHARALRAIPGVEIAAVYAPTRAHVEQFAARHGGVPYDSLERMLALRPLDLVVIGTPSYYEGSRWRGTRALDGGGALMNQGVHTVDLLLWLFGPVRRVFAKTVTGLHAIEVEDTAVAVLEFANGAIGTLEAATSAYPGYSRQIELTGANGTVKLDGDDLAAIDLQDVRDDERPTPPAKVTASAASAVVADATAHTRVFEDFISAVARRTAPACDGPSGRHSTALIEAIYQSARTDQQVDLT